MKKQMAVAAMALILVLLVSAFGVAKKDAFWGDGVRINILFGFPEQFTADQASWVRHGAMGNRYPGYIPDLKDETGNKKAVESGRVKFQLFINGVEISLRTQVHTLPGDEPGTWMRQWHHYVQFEPYYFEPGIYEFVGVWTAKNPNSGLGQVSPLIRTLTVEVVAP